MDKSKGISLNTFKTLLVANINPFRLFEHLIFPDDDISEVKSKAVSNFAMCYFGKQQVNIESACVFIYSISTKSQ